MRMSNSQPCQGQRMISPSLAGIGGLREPDQRAFAQGRALMRTAVQKPEELALDVEDRDRPAVDGQKFSRARRQFIHRGDDVTGH